ncbi:MAG: glycoside hydrolase family 9 protein, partial [Lachnospiraceae bacterium]|nr:glycoside hydrolase family 9 protein [Lachnospiraceae bacterium]
MNDNKFLVNHVGYLQDGEKTFLYLGEAKEFVVYRLQDLILTPVLSAPFSKGEDFDGITIKRGDFSEIKEEGIYRIGSGGENSRCFIIGDGAYGTVKRLLTYYFTWQRCNDDKGWNGNCHQDDKITLKDGRVILLGKGHHQSSDLRKWTFGTSLGMVGYADFALNENPLWDKGIIAEEIKHSADYYLSLIADNGMLYDCTWLPEGYDKEKMAGVGFGDYDFNWGSPRIYFESPSPESAHWNAIWELALIALYFDKSDDGYSRLCYEGAMKIWNYMNSPDAKFGPYIPPIYPPLGHDGFTRYFNGFYKDSTLSHAGRACAAAAISRFLINRKESTSGEKKDLIRLIELYQAAHESLQIVMSRRVGEDIGGRLAASCYFEGENTPALANNYIYFACTMIPQAFTAALELWADSKDAPLWREHVRLIAEQYKEASSQNPYGRLPGTWHTDGYDAFEKPGCFSFSTNENPAFEMRKAGTIRYDGQTLDVYYDFNSFCFNLDIIAGAVFMAQAAKILEDDTYRATAQRQIDYILGVNPFDSSNIEGVGYNHPHRGIFGEFYPP